MRRRRLGRHCGLLVVSAPDSATGAGGPPDASGFATRSTRFCSPASKPKGLTFSPEASRRTLVRRLYFDLWGLPPTPEQTDAFLADLRPDAWERLIDSLLASPRYGERWGRHWLDLAGYADSEGILAADYERSAAWRYRDFVIRSFNADTPYDEFLRLQIAGDEVVDYPRVFHTEKTLGPRVVEALVATGYLRCASDTSRPDFAKIKNAPGYYYQTLEDTMKIVASSTMGLTLQCRQVPHAQVRPDHAGGVLPGPGGVHERLPACAVGAAGGAQAD